MRLLRLLAPLIQRPRSALAGLPERARLTVEYHGWKALLGRLLLAPLRPAGLDRRVERWWTERADLRRARAWYREHGRPVTVVLTSREVSSRPPAAMRALKESAPAGRMRVVQAPEDAGFAASVNRGLAGAGSDDVVVLREDVVVVDGWIERLQRAAYGEERIGVVGPKLVRPDGRIESAGAYRSRAAPDRFDHRYRDRPGDHGPADVPWPALGVSGACMYLKRATLDRLGSLEAGDGTAFEAIDYCLRAVEAPSDSEVNELFNEAAAFVQTSRHEGFALPPLEAMAAGTPVVCTDAHGNRDFCRHEENCLMVEPDTDSVARGIERALGDAALRERLVEAGIRTAQDYRWDLRIDQLEAVLDRIADSAGRPLAGRA